MTVCHEISRYNPQAATGVVTRCPTKRLELWSLGLKRLCCCQRMTTFCPTGDAECRRSLIPPFMSHVRFLMDYYCLVKKNVKRVNGWRSDCESATVGVRESVIESVRRR